MLSHTSRLSLAFRKLQEEPKSAFRALFRHILHSLRLSGKFLKTCYVDGTKALVAGHYTRSQAAMIIAGNMPAILGANMITFPSILFPTPGHQAFYYFGNILNTDPTSLIPMIIGAVSSTLGLRIPLS